MIEPVMTILISYDKFTQCNKDLAEHHFANFVLKLCNSTSWPSSELKKICKDNWKMKLCGKLWGFFSKIEMTLDPNKLGNMFWGLWHLLHVSASPMEPRGFINAGLPSAWNPWWVFGRSGILFHTVVIFLGQTTSLFCTCHCCFCSACVYSLIYHFNPCIGTSVMQVPMLLNRVSQSLSAGSTSPGSVQRSHHRGQKANSCK